MKIEVNVQTLKLMIHAQREEAMASRGEAVRKWENKLREYVEYVRRKLAANVGEVTLKSPPYPPENGMKVFDKALRALAVHDKASVVMDSDEYDALMEGMERVRDTSRGYLLSISEVSYDE